MDFKFRRNKRGRVEAVYPDGRTSEIDDMSDYVTFREKWPMTPNEYLLFALGKEEGQGIIDKGPARDEIIKRLGADYYKEMIKDGVIKDLEYK
ncbi:hypothetical protein GH808_14410 [Acetobacterium fimetarium]|uniref:Uncharacterized protein n=1 Tax=Acetobacterium fimetarium TaxID=52691 RepID=A0ABR6WYB3_9FIRM|nr:hypothetical protein [Acetobacterium fimetarium]MBC3805599.1 hypothetical protein [Acetobacterium fimetarium]